MKVLWIKTELLHPVDKGGKIRTYQMLRAIAREHEVTYLCLDDGSAAPDAAERASEYARSVIRIPFAPPARGTLGYAAALARNLASSLPYAVERYKSTMLRAAIKQHAAGQDLVVCDFLAPAPNVPLDLPTTAVLFQHNVEAMIWQRHAEVPQHPARRAYMRLQWQRMQRYEAQECRRFAHVVAVSEQDAEMMRALYGAPSVSSVATGVDLDFFQPQPEAVRRGDEIMFVGSMDWMPNEDGMRWFVEECLPLIRAARPNAHLTIVGRNPSAALRQLAERAGGIEVTGSVEDVRPYLARAAVSVVPLRIGGGTRLKIYEAMATATPVVSTTIGAEGLPLNTDTQIRIGDTAASFAAQTLALLGDAAMARAQAQNALCYVRTHCGWDAVAHAFLAACVAPKPSG